MNQSYHITLKLENQQTMVVGQSSYCYQYKILKFMNFSKFSIKVENALDKLHFISWTHIQKLLFLWLEVTSSVLIK